MKPSKMQEELGFVEYIPQGCGAVEDACGVYGGNLCAAFGGGAKGGRAAAVVGRGSLAVWVSQLRASGLVFL